MYRNPGATVDVAVVDNDRLLLVRRGREPFRGRWVLPGGFVEYGERVEDAAIREVLEETGVRVELLDVLGVYSSPERDPRGHTITTVFVARVLEGKAVGGDDAEDASWFEFGKFSVQDMAFDHSLIVSDLMEWLKNRGTYWSSKRRA